MLLLPPAKSFRIVSLLAAVSIIAVVFAAAPVHAQIFGTTTTTPVTVSNSNPDGTVELEFDVAGLLDPVEAVALEVEFGVGGDAHTWAGDVEMVLTAPTGDQHVIFSRPRVGGAGSDSSDLAGTYLFGDGE